MNEHTNERTNERTNEQKSLVFYRTSSPSGPLPKNHSKITFFHDLLSLLSSNIQTMSKNKLVKIKACVFQQFLSTFYSFQFFENGLNKNGLKKNLNLNKNLNQFLQLLSVKYHLSYGKKYLHSNYCHTFSRFFIFLKTMNTLVCLRNTQRYFLRSFAY